MMITSVYICLIGLQGCATTTDNNTPRQVSTSPAERISAGSGAMHTGMSGNY